MKPIVVFTNFWDANIIINNGFFLFTEDEKVYNFNFISNEKPNFSVFSIALSNPPLNKLKHLQKINKLDFFCPTYNILKRYKDDKDWSKYTKDFLLLMSKRKSDLVTWIKSLVEDHMYILCCWENTAHGANCHRKIIYDKICESKASKNIIPIYRNGDKIYKKKFIELEVVNPYPDVLVTNIQPIHGRIRLPLP